MPAAEHGQGSNEDGAEYRGAYGGDPLVRQGVHSNQRNEEFMIWLSVVPAVLTIALAVWTKRILPSLLIGVLVGCVLKAQSVFSGFPLAIEYVIGVLSDKDNLHVLLFLYVFSALVQLIRRSGGIKAFTELAGRYIHGKRGVLFSVWGLIPLTFIDCGFRVVASGSPTRLARAKSH